MVDDSRVRVDSIGADEIGYLAGHWVDVELDGAIREQKVLTDFAADAHYVDCIQRSTGKILWLRRDLPPAYGPAAEVASGGPDVGSVWSDGYDLTKFAVHGTMVRSALNGADSVFAHGRWWGAPETALTGVLPEWWMGPWVVMEPGESMLPR